MVFFMDSRYRTRMYFSDIKCVMVRATGTERQVDCEIITLVYLPRSAV